MSDRAESLVDRIFGQEQKSQAVRAEALTSSLIEGHQAAASELLEADFATGVYAPKGLRWSLARGDNLEEKKLRLKKKHPEGELDILKESIVMGFDEDVLIYRESPQQRWKMVEPQGFDKFDIVEALAPSAESIGAEVGVALLTGGGSVPVTVARQAMGAFAGEAVEQGIQSWNEVQAQDVAGILKEPLTEGGLSAAGGFAMSPFSALYNAARGAGSLRVGDEGLEVMRAAKELDPEILEKLTPGLVTDNPAIRTSEAQAAALLPTVIRRYRELISKLDAAVRSASPGNAANASNEVVVSLNDFSDEFLRGLPVTGTRASEGGQAIVEGIELYSRESQRAVSALYDIARKIEEPQFELKPIFDLAGDLKIGAKGTYNDALDTPIAELQAITGPKQLSNGEVLSVTDQLRNVRSDVYDLASPNPGERFTKKHAQANDLAKAITEALENPKNTDQAFLQAWKSASDAARKRITTLEAAPIKAAAKSEAPSDLVRTYLRPGQYEKLLVIRNTVNTKQWREFVDAGYSELLRDPANLSANLKAFDQETLDVFMSRSDQVAFRKIAKELDRIGAVNANEIVEQQIANRNFIDTLINEGTPRDVLTLMKSTRGARLNVPARQRRADIRAAIVDWAWDGVVQPTKDGLKVNEPLLKSHIDQLKKSGFWRFLSPEEKKILSNAKIVSRAFQRVADAGTSILSASTVQGVQRLQAASIYTFLRLGLLGQFYTSSMGRKALIGGGLPNSTTPLLRAMGGTLAQMSAPNDISDLGPARWKVDPKNPEKIIRLQEQE